MARWLAPKTNSFFILFLILTLSGCGRAVQQGVSVGVPDTPREDSSLGGFVEGINYIRENPTEREEERVQRFLWLDQWMALLQKKGRLTPELGTEFLADLESFVKEPELSRGSLETISARASTQVGKNVAIYYLYQERLRADSVASAVEYLQQIQDDGISDYHLRAAELMQLNVGSQVSLSRKVGVLIPLTGDLSAFGQEVLNSIQVISSLAWSEGVEFVVADSGANDDQLLEAFQRLVLDENVSVVIGPLTSKASEFVFERAQLLRVPVISLAPRENLKMFGDYSFRSALTIKDQVNAIDSFVRNRMRARSVAVMFPDSTYGWDVVKAAKETFDRSGLRIADIQVYEAGATDFKSELSKMARLDFPKLRSDELCSYEAPTDDPDGAAQPKSENCVESLDDLSPVLDFEVLLIPDFADTVGLALPTLPFLKIYGVQVIGLSGFSSQRLIDRGQDHAEGVIFTDGFFAEADDLQTRFFVEKYESFSKKAPGKIAAEAFDVGLLLIGLMKRSGSVTDREVLVKQLQNVRNFPGVTGSLFSDGHEIRKQPRFLTVRNSEFQVLR